MAVTTVEEEEKEEVKEERTEGRRRRRRKLFGVEALGAASEGLNTFWGKDGGGVYYAAAATYVSCVCVRDMCACWGGVGGLVAGVYPSPA